MSEAEFKQAYDDVKNLKSMPGPADSLVLYASAKIAQGQKLEGSRPGIFNITGQKKWDEWKKYEDEGLTKEQAQKRYVDKYNELVEKIGKK